MEAYPGDNADRPGGELMSWRLLAWLELGTALLVALVWLLHTMHRRARDVMTATPPTLTGRRVLITKGDSDLGQQLARQFAREGCQVTVLATQPDLAVEGAEVIHCETSNREQVRALAERIGSTEVLVVCGAGSEGGARAGQGLDALAKTVSDELYANFHLLEELGGRLERNGLAVWVCAGEGRGSFAGAARALQRIAHTLLHQVANRRGCRAVWCEARGERGAALAARVVRVVARGGSLPTSADVFRELGYKLRDVAYGTVSRFCKLWT